MSSSSPTHLGFPPVGGQTVRAACEGGAWSSAVGALPWASAWPNASLPWRPGDADGHEAKRRRRAPMGKRSVARSRLAAEHD